METQDQAPEAVAEEPVAEAIDAPAADAAAEPLATEPVVEDPAPTVEEPAAEAVAPVEEAVAEEPGPEPEPEHVVDGLIDGDTLVPMSHPDGGSSDAYEHDDHGHLLVPATDVGLMVSHGFVVVEAE